MPNKTEKERLAEVKNEASCFYSMMALFKVACNNGDIVVKSARVGDEIRRELTYVLKKIRKFERETTETAPPDVRNLWFREFNERDYAIFASVFYLMANMSDGQRDSIETFCTAVAEGIVDETAVLNHCKII